MSRTPWIIFGLVLTIGFLGSGCSEEYAAAPLAPEPELAYTDVTVSQAVDLMENRSGLVIVDVSLYWALGHIPGAICYPVTTTSFPAALERWDRENHYLIYGRTDDHSMAAADQMAAAGFRSVYRLAGNFAAWLEAGMPINHNAPT